MAARCLTPSELAAHCDPATLLLEPPGAWSERPAGGPIVGQARALDAVRLGVEIKRPGFHLFVMGPPGSGRRSLVRSAVSAHLAHDGVRRSDWVYVHNFDQPHQPIALSLAAGGGARLRDDLRALVDELRVTIPAAFESEEYAGSLERLNTDLKERAEQGLGAVSAEAQSHGLVMVRTPVGFSFAPSKGDEVMSSQEFEALPAEERQRLQQALTEMQDRLLHALRASVRLSKEHADRLRALNRATTQLAVDHAVAETKARYAGQDAVLHHLEAVRRAVIDNAAAFRSRDDADAAAHEAELARYEVNLVVDTSGSDGAALIEADLPSYQNLIGRVDHVAHFGTLVTDFRHIKAGQLHRANGGYLMVDAVKLLSQPFAWAALKRALLRREILIESVAEMFSLVSTIQLEPQPIPLDVKVVLIGDRAIGQALQAYDPEFGELFRVVADLDDDLPRGPDTERDLAATLALQARALGLLPPSAAALARLIDHSARRSGDATRLDAGVRLLLDLMHEADHLARQRRGDGTAPEPGTEIGAADVDAAITARRARSGRGAERLRQAMLRELLTVATQGAQVGQVNALAAYGVGDELFGLPTRVTATTRLGDGRVVDIQRETRLGGPVHAKGVLILASFLAARYARLQPLSIAGSLVFEQTYGVVEGDSASLAELVALLTSIGGLAVRQGLALTGSVDQFGRVQAVGGVNEKVEAFFDLCVARGLDGTQGVLVPHSNCDQLMLRDDVVAAVAAGRFSVQAVTCVDDALEALTGLPAGDPTVLDVGTVNGLVARRLRDFSLLARGAPRARPGRRPAQGRGRSGTKPA
jgi:predicted ATP-dependent protease